MPYSLLSPYPLFLLLPLPPCMTSFFLLLHILPFMTSSSSSSPSFTFISPTPSCVLPFIFFPHHILLFAPTTPLLPILYFPLYTSSSSHTLSLPTLSSFSFLFISTSNSFSFISFSSSAPSHCLRLHLLSSYLSLLLPFVSFLYLSYLLLPPYHFFLILFILLAFCSLLSFPNTIPSLPTYHPLLIFLPITCFSLSSHPELLQTFLSLPLRQNTFFSAPFLTFVNSSFQEVLFTHSYSCSFQSNFFYISYPSPTPLPFFLLFITSFSSPTQSPPVLFHRFFSISPLPAHPPLTFITSSLQWLALFLVICPFITTFFSQPHFFSTFTTPPAPSSLYYLLPVLLLLTAFSLPTPPASSSLYRPLLCLFFFLFSSHTPLAHSHSLISYFSFSSSPPRLVLLQFLIPSFPL